LKADKTRTIKIRAITLISQERIESEVNSLMAIWFFSLNRSRKRELKAAQGVTGLTGALTASDLAREN